MPKYTDFDLDLQSVPSHIDEEGTVASDSWFCSITCKCSIYVTACTTFTYEEQNPQTHQQA